MSDLIATVRSALTAAPAQWRALAAAYPVEQLTQAPAPGEWSAAECLQHMLDVEKVLQFRLAAFLAGKDFPAFNPDDEGSKATLTPAEMAEAFTGLRAASLDSLSRLTASDLLRTARHPELGQVTLEQMLNEWVTHDLNHTLQALEALMQPYIHDCGPWHVYFDNHLVGVKG